MDNVQLLRPEILVAAPLLLLLVFLAGRRLTGLAAWRRRTAMVLQSLAALLLVATLAEPVMARPNESMNVVVVLDSSSSISPASRQQEINFARSVLSSASSEEQVRFVATGDQAIALSNDQVKAGSWEPAAPTGQATPGPAAVQPTDAQSQTNLAAGLRLASSLLGDTGRRRVVLASDGWETQGQAADEAGRLAASGIDLQVVALTALGSPEVVVQYLSTTPYVRVGDGIQSQVRIYSTGDVTATMKVSVDGNQANTEQVTLHAGENDIPLSQKAQTIGFHHVDVSVQATNDTSAQNNAATGTLVVKPQPRVLVLEERQGEATNIRAALASMQMDVVVRAPNTLPSSPADLDSFDAVVLNNVAATSMTLDQQRTLQEYVRRNGRGLVVIGGQTSFARGDYHDSVLEDVLPVSSQPAPRPAQGATALVLVIDRSASMDERSVSGPDVTKFEMAKEAAKLAVNALRSGDTIGVLTFDTENFWAVPARTISSESDKADVQDAIANIRLGGGTSIYPAVAEAYTRLRDVSAPSKHMVLLTDGREFREYDYTDVLNQIREANITLSTIGVGDDVDKELLTRLANLGQGRYYFTERIENIPQIVFKELDLSLKASVIEGSVQPHMLASSPLLKGFAPQDIPQISGYDITIPKSDATIALVSDQGDPLLAHWNYGLGRVVAYMSDVGETWAKRWSSWQGFAQFWDQAVRWSMASPINHLLQPSVQVSSSEQQGPGSQPVAHVSVESLNDDNSFADLQDVTAAIRAPSGTVTSTLLTQTAPGLYEGDIPLSETGAYELRVTRPGSDTGESVTEAAGFSVPVSQELLNAGTNDRLLKSITGGKAYLKDWGQVFGTSGLQTLSPTTQPLWRYFLPVSLLLLLASVAVRRLDLRLGRPTA